MLRIASIFIPVERLANLAASHCLRFSVTASERLPARILSELSEQIEQIGRNIFLDRALVDRLKRLADVRAGSRLLLFHLRFFAKFRVGAGIGIALTIGIVVIINDQTGTPQPSSPRPPLFKVYPPVF
jgi:hypothetical protein